MQSSNTTINVGLPSLSYGKSKQQRRGWLPLCCIICLAPAAVVAARLAYCLICLAYCIATLTPASQSYVTREDWFYSKHAVDNTTWPVPKIIHQTYKTHDVPQHWQHARQSCLDLHHDYRYMFWTDQSARELIAKEYPWFLSSYDSYPHTIQRVDALRYFALHRYGGIYLDLDVGCQWRLDGLRQHSITLPETDPTGFSNDVMAGAPDHPFMLHVIEALAGWNHYYGTKYPTVMFSTGPMFLTMQYMRYRGQRSEIFTLPAQMYSGSHGAFFRHYRGSSWHGADSRLVFWLYTNLAMVLPLLALAVVLTAAACWVLLVRDRKRKCY